MSSVRSMAHSTINVPGIVLRGSPVGQASFAPARAVARSHASGRHSHPLTAVYRASADWLNTHLHALFIPSNCWGIVRMRMRVIVICLSLACGVFYWRNPPSIVFPWSTGFFVRNRATDYTIHRRPPTLAQLRSSCRDDRARESIPVYTLASSTTSTHNEHRCSRLLIITFAGSVASGGSTSRPSADSGAIG